MTDWTEQRLGYAFGLVGGLLFLLGALVALALGTVDLVKGHTFGALDAWAETIVLIVVGGLTMFFAYLGHRTWRDRPLAAGLLLVVLAALGWAVLGLGANLLAIVGALFAFLAGILYLVGPVRSTVSHLATA